MNMYVCVCTLYNSDVKVKTKMEKVMCFTSILISPEIYTLKIYQNKPQKCHHFTPFLCLYKYTYLYVFRNVVGPDVHIITSLCSQMSLV